MSDTPPPIVPPPPRRSWAAHAWLALGLLLLAGLTAGFGWRGVLAAVASIGLIGFLGVCAAWLVVLAVLGSAWMLVAAGADVSRLPAFVWGRAVREAASDLLPFSQFGGLVVGADVAIRALKLGSAVVWASLVVDLTAEMAAQLVYTLGGVAGLGWRLTRPGAEAGEGVAASTVLWGGLALLAAGCVATAGFVLVQRRGVAWAARVAQRWLPGAANGAAGVQEELDRAYRRRGRLAASVAMHGVGWVASGVVSWGMLRLMGTPLPMLAVLTVESLMYAAKSFGFAIPGALGVQEAAYALLGPLFGLPPQAALALSLLKRARDIAVGAPVLVVWRLAEARRTARAKAAACR